MFQGAELFLFKDQILKLKINHSVHQDVRKLKLEDRQVACSTVALRENLI